MARVSLLRVYLMYSFLYHAASPTLKYSYYSYVFARSYLYTLILFNVAIYCFLDCFKSLVFFGLATRNVWCKYCHLLYIAISTYITGEICYGINMLIHTWTETAHWEHRRRTSIYRVGRYVHVVRIQKSVSGKHISLTAFRENTDP